MKLRLALAVGLLAGAPAVASAGERQETPDPSGSPTTVPAPVPPGSPGSTTVVAPPGSGGVTVVAPGPNGGSVTASGCSTVVVQGQPTLVGPGGAPCPTLQPYQPYQQPYYGPPPVYEARPRYARDPERSGALIASAVGFGVGTAVAGIAYLVAYAEQNDHCGETRWGTGDSTYVDNSGCGKARTSLITYGAIVTFVPSIPRFVVGDSTKGLIYTALRGASFATAALIDWGDKSDSRWQGPFLLGFAAPLTLGIIDLATTPHREDLEEKSAKAGITSVSPVAVGDGHGRVSGGMLAMGGLF
jgi:hypothetical protein